MNDDTIDKLYANQIQIDKNRRWLLQDKAGVAPRVYHFDINTVSWLFFFSHEIKFCCFFYCKI
jgi:hypothetical protein